MPESYITPTNTPAPSPPKKRKPATFDIDAGIQEIQNKKKNTPIAPPKKLLPPIAMSSIDFGEEQRQKDEESERLSMMRTIIYKLVPKITEK